MEVFIALRAIFQITLCPLKILLILLRVMLQLQNLNNPTLKKILNKIILLLLVAHSTQKKKTLAVKQQQSHPITSSLVLILIA